jgi:hypothetical protein
VPLDQRRRRRSALIIVKYVMVNLNNKLIELGVPIVIEEENANCEELLQTTQLLSDEDGRQWQLGEHVTDEIRCHMMCESGEFFYEDILFRTENQHIKSTDPFLLFVPKGGHATTKRKREPVNGYFIKGGEVIVPGLLKPMTTRTEGRPFIVLKHVVDNDIMNGGLAHYSLSVQRTINVKKCGHETKKGTPCKLPAIDNTGFCSKHTIDTTALQKPKRACSPPTAMEIIVDGDLESCLNELFEQFGADKVERAVLKLLRERNADIAYVVVKDNKDEDIRPGDVVAVIVKGDGVCVNQFPKISDNIKFWSVMANETGSHHMQSWPLPTIKDPLRKRNSPSAISVVVLGVAALRLNDNVTFSSGEAIHSQGACFSLMQASKIVIDGAVLVLISISSNNTNKMS